MPPHDQPAVSGGSIERARARLILRRQWLFALGWLASTVAWLMVFVVAGRVTSVAAVLHLMTQGAVIGALIALSRARSSASALRGLTCGACILLGIASIVVCARVEVPGDVLAFILLTLYLMAALAFAWGWRHELALLLGTMVPLTVALSNLEFLVNPLELVTAIVVGAVLSLAVAEAAARSFGFAVRRRESAEAAARELALSRNAYRDLAENAPDFIWAGDLEGRVTYLNEAAARGFGGLPSDFVGTPVNAFTTDHPANPRYEDLVARLVAGESIPPTRVQMPTVLGPRWLEIHVTLMRGPDGCPTGVRGISRDVHERVLAEERLRESEARFRAVVESELAAFIRADVTGRITYVNDYLCRLLGRSRESLIGASALDLVHPDDQAAAAEAIATTLRPPYRAQVQDRVCTTAGWRWFDWAGGAIVDDHGHLVEIQGLGHDIHERKEAEQALRASEGRYRGLVESQVDLIMRCDLDLRLTFVNDAYCQTVRVPREDLLGSSLLPLIHEDDRERALQALEQVQRPPYRVMLQTRGRAVGRWFEWESSGVLDADGTLIELQSVGRDVTERQRALEALRASEVRYRGLVESQQELVVRFTPDGRITYANKAGEKKFGMPSDAVVGQVLPLVHEDDLPRLQAILEGMRHPPYRAGFEIREITPEGWRWFEWEALAIHEHGELLEFQAVGRDVTERRAAAEALQKSLEELTRSQEQLRLLAQRQVLIREHERKRLGLDLHDDVCQELVGIGIMLESIRRRMGPTAAENASEFDRIARYLNQLVDHLRLLARELQPLQLHDLGLEGSLRSLAKGLTSESCFVDALFPTPIPRLGEEAEVAVYRIAQEALTNAIRHSDAGVIKLMLATIADNLCLEVSDDGCGFDPGDRSNALGLVSMEERALSLGGRLQIWSTIGRGTTVRLECPLGGRRGETRSAA